MLNVVRVHDCRVTLQTLLNLHHVRRHRSFLLREFGSDGVHGLDLRQAAQVVA